MTLLHLPLIGLYLVALTTSSPLNKRAPKQGEWKTLDEILEWTVATAREDVATMADWKIAQYFPPSKPDERKVWQMPQDVDWFVDVRCNADTARNNFQQYLMITNPNFHVEQKTEFLNEITVPSHEAEESKSQLAAPPDAESSIIEGPSLLGKDLDISPLAQEKMNNARKQILDLQGPYLEPFLKRSPSSFYSQKFFEEEAFFRGPKTPTQDQLKAPVHQSDDFLFTTEKDWQKRLRKGEFYHDLMKRRLARWKLKAEDFQERLEETTNPERIGIYGHELFCAKDQVWLYEQKVAAYARLWSPGKLRAMEGKRLQKQVKGRLEAKVREDDKIKHEKYKQGWRPKWKPANVAAVKLDLKADDANKQNDQSHES